MKEKILKYWWVIIIVLLIGGAFYWFEWRPAKIKHDCSWVKRHSDAVPEITQRQYDECVINDNNKRNENNKIRLFSDLSFCDRPRSARPAKDWWQEATKNQYDFCIHEKGL